MQNAVEYLIEKGHRDIGYITFPFGNQTTVRKRYEGYLQALKENGIKVNPDYVIIDDSLRLNELKATYDIMKEKIENNTVPTAYAVLADFLAIGLMKALKDLDYRIPQDISVIGFNNESICDFCEPPLTTVKQPKKLMGLTSMNLLLDIIEDKPIHNHNIILPTTIAERCSVEAPLNVKTEVKTI